MKVTELIKQKCFMPGEGVTEPPTEQGVRRFLFVLATHPWKLVALNILFLVFCMPVFTIPAALCGMNRVLIKLARDGNCFLWDDFIKEFIGSLLKSLPFGIAAAVLIFDSYYMFSVSVTVGKNGLEVFTAAAGFILLGLSVLFSGYAFVLIPSLELKSRHIAKNSVIFMMTEWRTNLIILGSVLAVAVIVVAFFPYSVFFLPVIGFSFLQLIVCVAVNEPLQRRIIEPYEQMQKEGLHNG